MNRIVTSDIRDVSECKTAMMHLRRFIPTLLLIEKARKRFIC